MLKKLGLDNTILAAKLAESLKSTLPVVAIVFAVCFIFIPVPAGALLAFVFGSILLVVGVGLFTIGVDMAMTPIGSHIGSAVTKSRSLMFALFISFLVGTFVTVSEPDLQVLAGQVPSIPNPVIIGAVALGVGIFLAAAMLRIFLGISLRTLLLVTYPIIIALAFFMPADYIGVAFDSGGVTTGPMTVPFIIALGVGVASSRSDSDAQNDSFGLVSLCSIGPILSMLVHDLQPILVYTTDEAMSYLPASLRDGQEYAALLDWYQAPWTAETYESYLAAYDAVVEARAAFTKAYETAVADGTLAEKTTQAARATLPAPAEAYELLAGELGCDLAEPFVCSEVELAQGEELACSVEPAAGEKCPRCWTVRELGEDGLCCRCHDAVAALGE